MLLLGISIFICHLSVIECHSCGHEPTLDNELVHGVYLEPHHVMRKRSIDQRLRFHPEYDGSISELSLEQQNLIKIKLIPQSLKFWRETLYVRQTVNNIKLQRQCASRSVLYQDGDPYPYCLSGCAAVTMCGEFQVPPDHLDVCRVADSDGTLREEGIGGEGVAQADFILYVSANESARCQAKTTVAYAASCQLETAFDRPVAGYVNLCPGALSTHVNDVSQMRSTIKHEILHALGFSAGLFAFFRDSQGRPRTDRLKSTGKPSYNKTSKLFQWGETTIKTVTYPDWKVRGGSVEKRAYVMVTPRVQAEVRSHFNCSSLLGAELEDQDIIGTALSHWEKRIFENEAMTGTYTQNPTFSHLTLALLEDTGWYGVDYSKAEPLSWGRGLGCDFVTKSCKEWIDDRQERGKDIHPFCSMVKQPGLVRTECTRDRTAVALCNLERYTDQLPAKYRYFTSLDGVADQDVGRYGGSVALADYCPYIQEFSWDLDGVGVRKSHCDLVAGGEGIDPSHNYHLEEQGADSVCIEHSAPWTLRQCADTLSLQHWGSGCYKYSCSAKVGLILHIQDKEFICPGEHYVLHIRASSDYWLHSGSLVCPSCDRLCSGKLNGSCPTIDYTEHVHQDITDLRVPCASPQHLLSLYILISCLLYFHCTRCLWLKYL